MRIVIGPDWKSTAAGWLSFALVTLGSISAFLASLAAASPKPNYTLTLCVAGVAFLTGLGRAWVGWLQNYVQTSPVSTPAVPIVVTLPVTAATPLKAGPTVKLGALMLITLTLLGTMPMVGCTAKSVAQNIVNWTPALQSAVATVDSTAAILMPLDAPIFMAATVGFDAASNLLVAEARAYLANPNATILAQLQAAVVAFQQQVSAAVLQAAKITNPASQQHVMAAINGVATIVNSMLALVASISSKVALAQMASASTIKLARIEPYMLKGQSIQTVADHYGMSYGEAVPAYDASVASLQQAGF